MQVTAALELAPIRATMVATSPVSVATVIMPEHRAHRTSKDLGVPLRGRVFRSNLHRFAPISTALPNASLRSLRAIVRPARRIRRTTRWRQRPCVLATALRASLVSASARRRCTPCAAGVGFAVQRFPHCAMHNSPHECLRSLHAAVSAPVRAAPPSPSAACCARLPAAPAAPPAAQSPRRLRPVGSPGVPASVSACIRAHPFGTALSCCASSQAALASTLRASIACAGRSPRIAAHSQPRTRARYANP